MNFENCGVCGQAHCAGRCTAIVRAGGQGGEEEELRGAMFADGNQARNEAWEKGLIRGVDFVIVVVVWRLHAFPHQI